ncbi:MAG: hypothetical protein ACYTFA_14105 [Planctomycetota bacterium]
MIHVGTVHLLTTVRLSVLLVFTLSTGVRPARAESARNSLPNAAETQVVQDQIWFGPNFGSVDVLDLFTSPEQWVTARSHIQVFALAMTQVATDGWSCTALPHVNCGENHLQNLVDVDAFAKLESWGIDLALDSFFAGPIASVDPIVCASAEEVFNLTLNGTANAINSVHANGGTVRYFAMDEPIRRWYPEYFYLVSGQTDPRPCLVESLDILANHVADYILFMQDALPSLSIGQIALYPEVGVTTLKDWILALEERGVALPFLQIDVHGPRVAQYISYGFDIDVERDLMELKSFLSEHNVALGVFVTDINWDAQVWEEDEYDDAMYVSRTMEWANQLRPLAEHIDHFLFQSWVYPVYTTGIGPNEIPTNLPDDDVALSTHTRLITTAVPILQGETAVPTVSTWGIRGLVLLVLMVGTVVIRRRRQVA